MLTQKRLKDMLSYDPVTGIFVWRHWRSYRAQDGDRAGSTVAERGWRRIRVDGLAYKAGRLAWLYMTGEWPPHLIDHINLDRGDDRWKNLRCATLSENQHNRAKQRRNSSGYKGVCWDRRKGAWVARICVNSKSFYLGHHASVDAAGAAYAAAAAKYHGEFARLT
jgi:hypothetical protein